MSGIFAFGDAAIVATDAIAGDTHVIVAGTHPGDRVVTVIAGVRTLDMRGIFAPGDNAVVAALTTSDNGNVVDSKHVGPYRGQVANLAFTHDPYMLAGRGAGVYSTGQRMASGALSRRTNKDSLYVTGFTTHHGMGEIQRKSRVVMIEIGADFKRSGAARIESTQHQPGHQSKAKLWQPRSGFRFIISGIHIFTAADAP